MPGFRDALIETAVGLNAAQAAFALRQEVEAAGRWEIEVLYGVYNLFNHQVMMPNDPFATPREQNVHLAHAPTNPREFNALALQMAEILRPHQTSTKPLESVEKEIVGQFSSSHAEADGPAAASRRSRREPRSLSCSTTRRPADLVLEVLPIPVLRPDARTGLNSPAEARRAPGPLSPGVQWQTCILPRHAKTSPVARGVRDPGWTA